MLRASLQQDDKDPDAEVVVTDMEQEGFGSTLNNRATGTDEEGAKLPANNSDTLGRDGQGDDQSPKKKTNKLVQPKRNFYVKYKAFPNLETMMTSTVWQKDEDAVFNYRAQFPVMMTPETLEKMEKFVFVLELWD